MSPPPPTKITHNCTRLRTTTHDYAQLSTMVDFIVLSIKLVCMVLYGAPFSHVFTELKISPIEVHISAIQLQISPIHLKISSNQLEISTIKPI